MIGAQAEGSGTKANWTVSDANVPVRLSVRSLPVPTQQAVLRSA
jgi:hypothetical protein